MIGWITFLQTKEELRWCCHIQYSSFLQKLSLLCAGTSQMGIHICSMEVSECAHLHMCISNAIVAGCSLKCIIKFHVSVKCAFKSLQEIWIQTNFHWVGGSPLNVLLIHHVFFFSSPLPTGTEQNKVSNSIWCQKSISLFPLWKNTECYFRWGFQDGKIITCVLWTNISNLMWESKSLRKL